ncbi:putative uncharacterized protein [Eubacterium sp. CAG:603]|nr:putative uncharacterized protein [Eubacterium sp. CAG:603]
MYNNMLRKLINHEFKKNTIICIGIIIFISVLNFMSVYIKGFADIYRKYVFVHISSIFSRITNIFRYSVGEVMITMGVFIVLMGLIIFIAGFMKYKWLKSLRRIYFKIVVYILIFIYATETLNCFALYHTTTIENTLYKDIDLSSDISDGERLINVYNTVVDNINKLSSKMKRDSDGDLIKNYSYNECKTALRNISDRFTCLSGYYPSPKEIYYSDIMTQQYLAGIYFPFSMEANYNKLMYISNMPSTICHELSHLKGYIRENEANFLSFVACIESDNEFIQYSGYLSVFYYLLDDIETYATEEEKANMHKTDKRAYDDTIFVKEDVFNEIEEKSLVSTDTLSDATDKFIDSNLKINGVSSGMDNYNEVVRLLIFYYF